MAKGQAKIPAWKAEWDRLVGDHKYLEIKNWAKYQPEMEEGNTYPWFKSYGTTDEDALADDEGSLVRWLKDALRRWRARGGFRYPHKWIRCLRVPHATSATDQISLALLSHLSRTGF